MGAYKGIEVEDELLKLLPHMQQVDEYRESLQTLQAVWDNLNLLGHLSATTTDMGSTRIAFAGLTSSLLNNLANRTLARRVQDISAKAQVVIDILVRNLFERTADIGFLATDERIRQFAAHPEPTLSVAATALSQRFKEYVAKYSVYFDIVLVAPQGDILQRLMPVDGISRCSDRFIQEALVTSAPYVESYAPSVLFADAAPKLIYSYRVNNASGQALAVLCLCFDLPDEMQRIFNGLERGDDWSVIALLDQENRVIASSEPYLIPPGACLDAASADGALLRFAGRSFLASRRRTQGYQGYMGPGWSALVLVPIEYAFSSDGENDSLALTDREIPLYAAILDSDSIFSPSLKAIPAQAETIQRELERSVWNGNIRQSSGSRVNSNPSFSKILLSEISATGLRMKDVFAQSIGKLQKTVISSILDDCRFLAQLAIDIMDRNLYERANDCRWWGLDPLFSLQLARSETSDRASLIARRLGEINDLYTVYENLLVFDKEQRVIAVSRPRYEGLVGSTLNAEWARATLALTTPERYVVSDFSPTDLYAGRPSYIYGAALFDGSAAVGGIGIVFDSQVQFAAMLKDALPPESPNAFGLFVDTQGVIIASTDERFALGTKFDLPADFLLAASQSQGESRLVVLGSQVLAVGARQSAGYREYKGSADPYRNDVIALVAVPMGELGASGKALTQPARAGGKERLVGGAVSASQNQGGVEIASFHVGDYWLGLRVKDVVEAVELKGFVRIPNAPAQIFGSMVYRSQAIPLYNLRSALGVKDADYSAEAQVVVIDSDSGKRFGVLVDSLGEISQVADEAIEPAGNIFVGMTSLLASIVKSATDEGAMLTLLSVASMVSLLEEY